MRNMNPKIVEILHDGSVGPGAKFRCKVCGIIWYPNIEPYSDGKFYRGAWQCPNGCKVIDGNVVHY